LSLLKVEEERKTYLNHLKDVRKNMTSSNTVILSVLGEIPYAEFEGDVGIPYCLNSTHFGG
jgi:hypothetical protein